MKNTSSFEFQNLKHLVLDEADRLLDLGFQQQVKEILAIIEDKSVAGNVRQNILASATISKQVSELAAISLVDPVLVNADAVNDNGTTQDTQYAIPQQLVQHFMVVPAKLRLPALAAFVRTEMKVSHCKIIVFVSTCDSVDFHTTMFKKAKWPKPSANKAKSVDNLFCAVDGIFSLHGNIKQSERVETISKFSNATSAILFCTDVAARGLNLPTVQWIIQYDPPTETRDYVHRVGRTARSGNQGNSLLFLMPSETDYLQILKKHDLAPTALSLENTLIECAAKGEFQKSNTKQVHKIVHGELQYRFEQCVLADENLFGIACQAFHSFVRSYATHSSDTKSIFQVRGLHFGHVAKSFGLRETPGSSVIGKQSKQSSSGSLANKRSLSDKKWEANKKAQKRPKHSSNVFSEFSY